MTDWNDLLEQHQATQQPGHGRLADAWVVPPFSVLNTLSGDWRARKDAWLSLGIESELGRDDGTKVMNAQARMNEVMRCRCGAASTRTGDKTVSDPSAHQPDCPAATDDGGYAKLSIFDPVLCELVYRWWCPAGGSILDPFAGGSVRGVVAALLGHPYTGIELSAAQVAANRAQAKAIVPGDKPLPRWLNGDSLQVLPDLPAGEMYDMVFTCPPYYDLERYSDDPADLSAMPTYREFLEAYNDILAMACRRLRKNRLAVVVVSDVRDRKTGFVQPLTRDTELAFDRADTPLWTSGVLVNSAGTLALRQQRHMAASRKLGRMHQDVLVFANGAPDGKGWSYDREAPPSPQQSLGWDLPDDRPTPLPLPLDDPQGMEAVVHDANAKGLARSMARELQDAMAAAVGADPADAYTHVLDVHHVTNEDLMAEADLGADDDYQPDVDGGTWASPPTTAQDARASDTGTLTPPQAPAPATVAGSPPAAKPDAPPWAKWLPPDDTPAVPHGVLGQPTAPPARNSERPEVRVPADLSGMPKAARAEACQQCGQPRGPGHQDHHPWVTPEEAQGLVDAGLWDGYEVQP